MFFLLFQKVNVDPFTLSAHQEAVYRVIDSAMEMQTVRTLQMN